MKFSILKVKIQFIITKSTFIDNFVHGFEIRMEETFMGRNCIKNAKAFNVK